MLMLRRTAFALAAIAFTMAAAAEAATVTRGPYLQLGTHSSVVVRWRTDTATNSRVRYGSAPGSLTLFVDNTSSSTAHEVKVSGLSPNTRYYYSVGTTTQTLAGADANHFFLTAPTPGTPKPTRIWVLGDSGTANANAQAVRNAYYSFTGTHHTDLWLMLGDNAYSTGTDSEYQAAVFNMYPEMLRKSVLWPTLGNHDGSSANSATQTGPYYDIFSLPRNAEAGGIVSGTEAYYSFDYANLHFVVLDSFESSRLPGGAMMTWLTNDLMATAQDWIIAYWHHPPHSKGFHDSDTNAIETQMRQYALPILENHGVDLVLSGHNHTYERSFLIDGHYGTSDTLQSSMILDGGDGRVGGDGAYQKPSTGPAPHEGAVYTVAGSSGQTGTQSSLDHPAMFYSAAVLGSVVLDVQGSRLDATFLDSTGTVRDSFTIEKGQGGCGSVATVEVSPPSATVNVGATVALTAVPRNAGGGVLSGCGVSWSSSAPGVATVSSGGVVTGVAAGTATVTATTQGVSGQSAITVSSAGQGTLSVIKRGAIHVSTNAASYSFASITASNNRLYVAFVSTSIASGTAPSATIVSGAGLTFTEIGTPGGVLYSGTPGLRRIQAWRALVGSGAATGSIAISLGATSTSMDAVLLEFSGMTTSGTNGSGAIVQSATNKATSATALTAALSAFASASNRPAAFFNHDVAQATTPESGYTELDDASHSSPAAGAECEWRASTADTTPSVSWSTAAAAGGFALEIRANGSGPGNQAPVVSAGPDLTITLPNSASLNGTVSDDGLPNPPATVTSTWSKVSGPGTVTFGNPNVVDTTASFSAAGTYVLRLTGSDSQLSSSNDATVTVNAAGQGTLSVLKQGAIHVSTDATSYSFAPITASNNRLYVVFLSTSIASGTVPLATSVSGAGMTFTEIGTAGGVLYSGTPGVRRIQAWRALVGSGAATGSIVINLNGTSIGMDAVLLEFSGVNTSGTNGSGAVVQSASNKATSGTSLTVTLSAFGSPTNRPVAFFNHRVAEATTHEPGYTELDDASHSAPAAGAECEWHGSTADTTPSASWATAAAAGGFAIEVRAGP